jgi:uncharacterized protein (DUF58 family)
VNGDRLTPPPVEAACVPRGHFGFAFGRRFFFLLIVGSLWVIPAFWNRTFLYGLLAWDAFLIVVACIDLLQLPKPSQLTIERVWPVAPSLDSTSAVTVVLRNRGSRRIQGALIDNLPQTVRRETPAVEISAASGREGRAQYDIRPTARGDIRAGKAYLRYQGALQMAERWCVAALEQTVRVYPNLEQIHKQTIYLTRSRQIELEKRLLRQRGMGREFESLRDYREGDEFRDICWTATARRARLVTKLHQMERSQAVWIVIDSGRLMRARVGGLTKLDHAVNAALSLANLALYSGDRVGLLAYGRKPTRRIAPDRGPIHLRHIAEQLALVAAETNEADHLRAAGTLLGLQKRRALIVWLTDLAETAMTPELVESASQMLRRHLVIFLAIGQPDLERVAQRRPENSEEMFESMAAVDMVQRRELLIARLRDHGALALEVTPQKLSTSLLNQYLAVKEQSLL